MSKEKNGELAKNIGKAITERLVNVVKFLIIFIAFSALLLVLKVIPQNVILGTTLPDFVGAVITVTAILTCTAVTGKMFGAAFMSFVMPFVSYYCIGLFSPAFIAVHIFANFMMVFLYNLVKAKNETYLTRGISIIVAGATRYGLLFIFSKIGAKAMKFIMIFQNVTDDEGLAEAVKAMKIDSLHGQLIATILGVFAAFGVAALFNLLGDKRKALKLK